MTSARQSKWGLKRIHFLLRNYNNWDCLGMLSMSLSDDQKIAFWRPAFGNPTTHTGSPLVFDPEYDVCFHHPGYQDPHNILLILPGLDHPDGGIYHRVALWACGILAANEFDGWFTEDREGHIRVTTPLDGILRKRDYYYHIPGDHSCPYPIVSSFGNWAFPHGSLPRGWKIDIPREAAHPTPRQSTLAEAVLSRDVRCRITNHIEGTECAHLIHRNQSIWFQRNMMTRYGRLPRPNCDPVDNPRSVILLRSDICSSFDSKRFAFIPKPEHAATSNTEPSAGGSLRYVTHVFNSPGPHELTALYHNVSLQPISGVAPEFLFARFAWTIFQHVHIFLQAGLSSWLAQFEAPTGSAEAGSEVTPTVKSWSAEQCRLMPLRNKPRSSSPRKRKPDDAFVEDDGPVPRGRKRERHGGAFISSLEPSSLGPDTPSDGPWNPAPLEEQSLDTDLSDVDAYDDDGSWGRYCERSRKPFDSDARLGDSNIESGWF